MDHSNFIASIIFYWTESLSLGYCKHPAATPQEGVSDNIREIVCELLFLLRISLFTQGYRTRLTTMTPCTITGSQAKIFSFEKAAYTNLEVCPNFILCLHSTCTQFPIVMFRLYEHPSHIKLHKFSESCHTLKLAKYTFNTFRSNGNDLKIIAPFFSVEKHRKSPDGEK